MTETNESPRTAENRSIKYTQEINELKGYIKVITDNTVSYALLLDPDGKILYYSDSLLNLAKIPDNNSLIGIQILDAYEMIFSDKEIMDKARRRFSRVMSGENEFYEDDIVAWSSGEKRFYQITYKRIADEKNGFNGIFIFALDITNIRLEEANRRMNDLLQSAKLPCLIWDETGRITAFNKEAASTFGTSEDLSLDEFNNFYFSIQMEQQPDGRKTETIRQNVIRKALEKGFSQAVVWKQNAAGTRICFTVNITRIAWLSDYRLVVYYNDQTDRMTKEAEAREAEKQIRLMLDAAPLGCILINDNFDVIECNYEALKMFNIPDKKIFMDDFFRFSPEIQSDGQSSRIKADGYLKKLQELGHSAFEWLHQDYHGEPIPAEVTLARIKYGNKVNTVCYVRDLREYKKMIAETNEANERVQFMFNSMPITATLFNRNLKIVDCNQECLKLFGVSSKEEYVERFYDLSPEYQPNGLLSKEVATKAINKAFEEGYNRVEYVHHDINGEQISCEVVLVRMNYKDDLYVLGYAWDLRETKAARAEASEANERMQFMFNSMPFTANLISEDLEIVDCNQECFKLYGVSSKEEYIERFYDFSPEYQPNGLLSKEVAKNTIKKAFEEGYCRFEFLHQNTSGEQIPCEVVLVRMNYKEDLYVLGYAWDLRETKAARAEASEANERIKLMLDLNPLMCVMRDDKGNIIDCNQETLNMLGAPDKTDFCKNFYSYFPEIQSDGSRTSEKVEEVIQALSTEKAISFEREFRSRTGETIPVETKIVRIPWKDTHYYLSFSRDLREYVRLVKDKEESHTLMNKFVAILENVDSLISITDSDYNLIYMNNNMANVFGVNRDECIGRKCYKAIRNQDKPCSICQFPKLLPDKDALPTQFDEYLWDDILGMWTESKGSIIRWIDDSLVFFHSINDRSVKKAYEDEMRKATDASIAASAAKTTFLANMSHEIRTPMNSIIGFAELAMDDNVAPKTKDYLGKIVENSTWLLQIINDILDISKIESGKMELESTPFNLHSVISRCQSVIHPIANEKGLDLRTYAEPPAGKKLLGDPVRLYQALMNLLSNAVKFTNSGIIRLSDRKSVV